MNDSVGAFVPHSPPPMNGSGEGPLAGLTFAVKDLYDIAGHVTGGGSPDWLRTHGPATHTAPVVAKLLDAGANMIGKTVCDELFYSITGANAHYGTPRNSRAPERMPGGSSSGSAVAVAAGLCDFALGSDTGGSVRMPASFCGLYGLRPTHGRVDLTHGMAMAPSFDTGGWFARGAALYRVIGTVLLDGEADRRPIERIIIAEDCFAWAEDIVATPLRAFLERAAVALPQFETESAARQGFDESRECFRTLQAAEVWRTFGDWIESTRPALGPGIRERCDWAATVSAEDESAAAALHRRIGDDLRTMIPPGTVVCLPSAAALPPKLAAGFDALEAFRRGTMALTCLSGLSGLPQISIPAASAADGCPIGLSFLGWQGGDEALLDLAVTLEPYAL